MGSRTQSRNALLGRAFYEMKVAYQTSPIRPDFSGLILRIVLCLLMRSMSVQLFNFDYIVPKLLFYNRITSDPVKGFCIAQRRVGTIVHSKFPVKASMRCDNLLPLLYF